LLRLRRVPIFHAPNIDDDDIKNTERVARARLIQRAPRSGALQRARRSVDCAAYVLRAARYARRASVRCRYDHVYAVYALMLPMLPLVAASALCVCCCWRMHVSVVARRS